LLARRRTPDTVAATGQRLRRRRMSAKRKQSAVLRPLRSEDLELVSRRVRGDVGRAERLARRLR
jgi:hypothetical protein